MEGRSLRRFRATRCPRGWQSASAAYRSCRHEFLLIARVPGATLESSRTENSANSAALANRWSVPYERKARQSGTSWRSEAIEEFLAELAALIEPVEVRPEFFETRTQLVGLVTRQDFFVTRPLGTLAASPGDKCLEGGYLRDLLGICRRSCLGKTSMYRTYRPRTNVLLLDPALHVTTPGIRGRRQRVIDNLLGNRDYCPTIRRTEILNMA